MLTTSNEFQIDAEPDVVFDLAADVCAWPRILPHYRYVTVLATLAATEGRVRREVKMAASRDGFPVSWTSVQEVVPQDRSIHYHHIAGVTTGMDVVWTLSPFAGGTRARIEHWLEPRAWWLRNAVSRYVVGQLFISNSADKTLRGIAREVESRSARQP